MLETASSNSKSIKIDGANKLAIEVCKQRVIAVSVIFFVTTLLITIKLFYISVNNSIVYSNKTHKPDLVVRGRILDRNGKIIATSLPSYSLYLDATKVKHPLILLDKLLNIIPINNKKRILEKINNKEKFIYVARQLSPENAKKILYLGEPSLDFIIEPLRIYPLEEETSVLVGHVGLDDNAHAGVERSYNNKLKKGKDVVLTIDSRLQSIVYNKLKEGLNSFKAKAAVGIIIDVTNGEVLAATSFPNLNPNIRSHHSDHSRINRVTMSNYEIGSIFKSFTIASALNEDIVNLNSKFDASKPFKVKGLLVEDFHAQNRILDLEEVFLYSSNIGSSKIAMELGKDKQNYYFSALGFKKDIKIGIFETSSPIFPANSAESDIAVRSYGYGISINPLQALAALAATVNGGMYIEPMVVKDPLYEERPIIKVFKPEVSSIMKHLYRIVVEDERGTANLINIKEYDIGGKTGTADKYENGKYNSKKNISSFVAFLPINQPKYGIFILLDEPNLHKNKESTAGWTAVPIAKEIIKEMAPVIGEPSKHVNLNNNLVQEIVLQ